MQLTLATKPSIGGWNVSSHVIKRYFGASTCALLLVPVILSENGYSWLETFLGLLLLVICVYPSARYMARREAGLPTMAVFCGAYAIQFAFPIFTHDATFELVYGVKYLDESDVTAALLLAIVGICALQAGYYWFQRSDYYRRAVPVAHLPLAKSKAIVYCILVGIFLPLLFTFKGIIPEEFQQSLSAILRLLENQELVVIGILGWIVYGRKESKFYAVWLYAVVMVASMRSMSMGTLEGSLIPIGVLLVVKWLCTGRIPVGLIVATAALMLFLSPVKLEYRARLGRGEDPELAEHFSLISGRFWIEQATDYWKETLAGNRGLAEATERAMGRTDFIHQVAHIYSMTPEVIPYQYGKTYTFFAVALIPRVIWPDKPTAGSANGFYAVTYGITSEEGAKRTTFGVSILGEAFINFGWVGVVFVMLLLGILIGVMHHSFGGFESGPGGQAVFIAFFVYFLNGIGSSAEIMFGGILQNLLCGYVLLLWAKEKTGRPLVGSSSFISPVSLSNKS